MDISILLALQDFRNGAGAVFAGFLSKMTWLGELNTVIVIMALIYWCFSKEAGTYLLLGWSGNRLANGLLKVTACAYRPWIRDARVVPYGDSITTATGYSFPSGHTMNAATIFGGGTVRNFGNTYPTHALGPICLYMDMNRGDRLESVVAVSSLATSSLGYSGTVFADRHGSGDTPGALAAFRSALVLAALSIPYFILAAPFGHALLGVFNTAPEVLAAESAYYDVLLANGYFTMLAAVLGGYFTGQGKTRFVGAVTVFGFLVNMAIVPIFINGLFGVPTSGIRGAGWSATISHIVPCVILAVAIRLRPLECRARQMCRADFRTLLSLGSPNGVRAVIDIGGFFVFAAVLAECEGAAVAASTAAFAVNGIYQALPQGLSQALEIMTARAARENRSALLAPALRLVAIHALAFIAVLSLFGRELLNAFATKGYASFADGFSASGYRAYRTCFRHGTRR